MVKEVKILEVHVDKGMKHGQKITFGGEADQAPGVEPGDIVLVLQEKDHEVGRPGKVQARPSWVYRLVADCCGCFEADDFWTGGEKPTDNYNLGKEESASVPSSPNTATLGWFCHLRSVYVAQMLRREERPPSLSSVSQN